MLCDASTQTVESAVLQPSAQPHIRQNDVSTQCYYHQSRRPDNNAHLVHRQKGPTPVENLKQIAPLLETGSLYIRELSKTTARRKNLEWLRYAFITRAGRQLLWPPLLDATRGIERWHRVVCVDWLCEVAAGFRLRSRTLSRCVAIFDDALRRMGPKKAHLQRYAITALVLSAKMEETHSINVRDYADMTCGVCTMQDVLETEMELLTACGFDVLPPSTCDYLQSLLCLLDLAQDPFVALLSEYAAETFLYDPACSQLAPHSLACAAISIATGGKHDAYLTDLSTYLFEEDWENARAAAVNAFEECHVHDFQRVVKGNTREVTMATKARHKRVLTTSQQAADTTRVKKRLREDTEQTESSDFVTTPASTRVDTLVSVTETSAGDRTCAGTSEDANALSPARKRYKTG